MVVHLYTSSWNEERIIPFFLQHYEPLVARIVVYDDNSSDGTRELLGACSKIEIRQLERGAQSFLDAHLALFDSCWHESRGEADWVCLVDMDEFVFHPEWHSYLAAQKDNGATVIDALGYDMVSETFPARGTHLPTALNRGQRDFHFDKPCLFRPEAIERMNHTVGRHGCVPSGNVIFSRQRYAQLRHYKSLGLDYLLARSHALAGRLTNDDLTRGWCGHYLNDDESIRAHFLNKLKQAEEITAPRLLKKAEKRTEKKPWWKLKDRFQKQPAISNKRHEQA